MKKNGNKYLILTSTDENKEVLTKYTRETKNLIEKISNKLWIWKRFHKNKIYFRR